MMAQSQSPPSPKVQEVLEGLEASLFTEQESTFVENLVALRVQNTSDVAPYLSKELLERILKRSLQLRDTLDIKRSLHVIAPFLQDDLVSQAFKATLKFPSDSNRAAVIGALGPYIPKDLQDTAIQEVNAFPKEGDRLTAWMGMVSFLPLELKNEAVNTAIKFSSGPDQVEALVTLAPQLPNSMVLRVLEFAQSITNPVDSVRVIAALVRGLHGGEKGKALNIALDITRNASDPLDKTDAFLHLLRVWPDQTLKEVVDEALQSTRWIDDSRVKSQRLEELAKFFPESERVALYQESLDNIFQFVSGEDLVEEASRMVVEFPAEMVPRIVEAVENIPDPDLRLRVYNGIAELLPDSVPPPAEVKDIKKAAIDEEEAPTEGETKGETLEKELPKTEAVAGEVPEKTEGTKEEARRPTEAQVRGEGQPVAAFLHSDKWTLKDQLNYSIYAKALAEFIVHKDTDPPLTVGILAPWGHGKTTLMRLVQYQLWLRTWNDKLKDQDTRVEARNFMESRGLTLGGDELVDSVETEAVFLASRGQGPIERPNTTFSSFQKWLDELSPRVELPEGGETGAPPKLTSILKLKKLDYPTVWFNAWKYQTSEQIWAGLAYAIISQLVNQIPKAVDREKFWLALQFERLDVNAIRQDIHKAILERFLPGIFIWSVVTVIGLLLTAVGAALTSVARSQVALIIPGFGIVTTLAGVIPIVRNWLVSKSKVEGAPLEGKFAQYVRQPSYEEKAGFFQEVEQDIRRVFDLLVTPGKPAVVFIDDLDRCSPGKVAEVIEAVNLFLSGDFPNCYFVLGADAQVVAASLEMAYEKLSTKLASVTRNYGSLGWYFMDKFIQLQFIIPNITPDQRTRFLGGLFRQTEIETTDEIEPQSTEEAEKKVQEVMKKGVDLEEIAREAAPALKVIRRNRPEKFNRFGQQYVELQAEHFSDNDPDILKYLERYESYLGTSPRTMKRFANQYRFYGLIQSSRQILELPFAAPSDLPPWLVIMLRWPQLVRWIQWEGEIRMTGGGTNPLERAKRISEQIRGAKTYEDWLAKLKGLGAEEIEWLVDKQLYEFLRGESRDQQHLNYPVQVGIW